MNDCELLGHSGELFISCKHVATTPICIGLTPNQLDHLYNSVKLFIK